MKAIAISICKIDTTEESPFRLMVPMDMQVSTSLIWCSTAKVPTLLAKEHVLYGCQLGTLVLNGTSIKKSL